MVAYVRNPQSIPDDTPGGSSVRQAVKDQNSTGAIDDLFVNLNAHSNSELGKSHVEIDASLTDIETNYVPVMEGLLADAQDEVALASGFATDSENSSISAAESATLASSYEATFDTVASLTQASGEASLTKACFVKDLARGGSFIYDATKVVDDNQGTNFNGWVRQYSDKVNALWWGVVSDGVTDNTTMFQAIATFANTNLGINLYLPTGTYMINTGTITFLSSDVSIVGDGAESTIISTTSQVNDLIVFGNGIATVTHCYINDIRVTSSVVRTAGAAVTFNGTVSSGGSRWQILSHNRGLSILDSVLSRFYDSTIGGITPTTGVGIYINGGNDQSLTDILISGTNGSQPLAGVYAEKTGGLWMDNVGGLWCGNGLYINPKSGDIVENIFSQRCAWDSNSNVGLYINCVAGATVRRVGSVNDWSSSNISYGVLIDGAGTIQGVELNGFRSLNNGLSGVLVNTGTDIKILGGFYSGNSQTIPGNVPGIVFTSGEFSVIGATCGQSSGFGNTQNYGIQVTSGDNFNINSNDVTLNTIDGILLASPPASTRNVKDNLGYLTETSGSATGTTNASGDIVVAHGLGKVPSKIFLQLSGAADVVVYQAYAQNATTFTIRFWDMSGIARVGVAYSGIYWQTVY